MYYHVLIETQTNSKIFIQNDIKDIEYIEEQIIVPYLTQNNFIFNGFFIESKQINRLLIKKSQISGQEYAQKQNKTIPSGLIIHFVPSDIIKDKEYCIDITIQVFNKVKQNQKIMKTNNEKVKIFIVHGHDELAKTEVARFLERLNFEVIILHEQASRGKTIIEKIDFFSDVAYAIVLYTKCDVGGKHTDIENLQFRARQNVIFEHGYLIAKLGRDRVCALVKGNIEMPNDISGMVYIKMDAYKAWQGLIIKELKDFGLNIDANILY